MIAAVVLVVLVIVIVLMHDYARKRSYRWEMLSKFPGDPPLAVIGNTLQLGFDADEESHRLMDLWRKFGKKDFRVTVGTQDWVILCTPENVMVILNHPTELCKVAERNLAMMPFFGNSVSISEGEQWRSTRKLMAPSFKFKTLEKRVSAVNMQCDRLFNVLDKLVNNKVPIDVFRYLKPFMFDLLCNTLMGVHYNLLGNPDHSYLISSQNIIKTITVKYFSYWRNIRQLFVLTQLYRDMMTTIKVIRKTSQEIIQQRKETLNKILNKTKDCNIADSDFKKTIENNLMHGDCLLDSLLLSKLHSGNTTTEEIINDEITFMCFTGHYTTSVAISHVLYHLAKYPEIQKKVLNEQQRIFRDDYQKRPTFGDINEMKYLAAVINESMRVVPTVSKIGRQLQNDLILKDGRIIPAGSTIIIFYKALFSNPLIFPEPEKFYPERFYNTKHPSAFVPFSAGPRNCIGFRFALVAMKTTLSNILRRYEVSPGGAGNEPQFVYRILTESKNGIQLNFKRRNYNY